MGLVEHAKFELELQGLLSEEGDFYGGIAGNKPKIRKANI